MKAAELQGFLRSLGGTLAVVGVSPRSLEDLRSVAQALEPFNDLSLDQLTDFLQRAAGYRRTGEVPAVAAPGLEGVTNAARDLGEAVGRFGIADAATAGQSESRLTQARSDLRAALTALANGYGIKGKLTEDAKWLDGLRTKAEVGRTVQAFRAVSAQVTGAEDYQSESVRTGVENLAANDTRLLKAAAAELGVTGTGSGKKFVESVLGKLTGVANKPPKAAKKAKATEPAATDERVESMVLALQDMATRAKDPRAVPDAEVEAILARVSTEFSTTQHKAIAKRVTGTAANSAEDAIARIRADLTAGKRLLESQHV